MRTPPFRLLTLPFVLVLIGAGAPQTSIPYSPGRVARSDADWVTMVPMEWRAANAFDCDSPILISQLADPARGVVYQEVCRWATSSLIVEVRLSDGHSLSGRRAIAAGNSLGLITTGKWRGMLLIQQHRYRKGGGSYDPTFVIRPTDGKVLTMVPGSDRDADDAVVTRWLARNGWKAVWSH